MNIDRALMMFAGIMILISLLLTHFVHPGFVWFTVFIAANLMQASVTGFCPAVIIFRKLGIKSGCAFK